MEAGAPNVDCKELLGAVAHTMAPALGRLRPGDHHHKFEASLGSIVSETLSQKKDCRAIVEHME